MSKRFLPLLLTAFLSVSTSAFASQPTAASEDVLALAQAADLIRTEAGAHRLILLGEMHGTREAPKLLAALATVYAQEGPVVIGMELDSSLQPVVDGFMASDGGKQARAKLLAAPAWHVPRARNDGRRNLEVISLIGYARSLKAQGRDIRFLMFDIPRGSAASSPMGTAASSAARDKAMAGRIREAYSKLPAGRLLALSGNVHAMLLKPAYAPHLQPPMGSHLRDLKPFSVNVMARGGEYWACGGKVCGPAKQSDVRAQSGPVDMFDGFNLRVVLPRFTIARLIPE